LALGAGTTGRCPIRGAEVGAGHWAEVKFSLLGGVMFGNLYGGGFPIAAETPAHTAGREV